MSTSTKKKKIVDKSNGEPDAQAATVTKNQAADSLVGSDLKKRRRELMQQPFRPGISNGNGSVENVTKYDLIYQQREQEFVWNEITTRRNFERERLDNRRSINDECGYPEIPSPAQYKELYERESIATRSVEVLPKKTWTLHPKLVEDEDPENETSFELAWEELAKQLKPTGWLKAAEGYHAIWEYLRRVDILSGIGHFGVLLLGLDDVTVSKSSNSNPQGVDKSSGMEQEVRKGKGRKLLFLRAFDESLVEIARFETDPSNPRFGHPVAYNITFNDPSNNPSKVSQVATQGYTTATKEVHWTRIIHIADNLGSSEIFGVPRMRPIYNRLYDLRKLYGGSAEMYWKGAFPGLSLETHPQLGANVTFDMSKLQEKMDLYSQGLQRYITLEGAHANSLAPQVVDPSPQIDVQITAICIVIDIPKRIFMGSERGELASGQDSDEWNKTLAERQNNYVTPRIIGPFVDRLIDLGVLPEPSEGYTVSWPDLNTLDDLTKSTIVAARVKAMADYIGGSVEQLMPPFEFLTKEMGFTEEEAEAIIKSALDAIEQEETLADLTAIEEPEPDPFTDPMDMLKQKQLGDIDLEKVKQKGKPQTLKPTKGKGK